MKTKVLITMAALMIFSFSMPSASAEVWQFQKTTNISFGGFDVMFFFDTENASTYPANGTPIFVMIKNNLMDFPESGSMVKNQDWNVSFSKEYSIVDGLLNVHNFTVNRPSLKKTESRTIKFERK